MHHRHTPAFTNASSIMKVRFVHFACLFSWLPPRSRLLCNDDVITGFNLCGHGALQVASGTPVNSANLRRKEGEILYYSTNATHVVLLKPRSRDCSYVILMCLLGQYFSVNPSPRGCVQTRCCCCCCCCRIPSRSVHSGTHYISPFCIHSS